MVFSTVPFCQGDELGWLLSENVEEGSRNTVKWYLTNEDWWRALQDLHGVGARLVTQK